MYSSVILTCADSKIHGGLAPFVMRSLSGNLLSDAAPYRSCLFSEAAKFCQDHRAGMILKCDIFIRP